MLLPFYIFYYIYYGFGLNGDLAYFNGKIYGPSRHLTTGINVFELKTDGIINKSLVQISHYDIDGNTQAQDGQGIENDEDLALLKTAALFHDTGFLYAYKGHEDLSCIIARENLPHFEYAIEQIEKICEIIQATTVPQSPKNKLGEIIADADLDYLGRDDFYPISNSLFNELKNIDAIDNLDKWNQIQIDFISQHQYFTTTSINRRSQEKEKRLEELKKLII